MRATVGTPLRIDDAPNGVRMYVVTVTGFDVPSHRRLARAAVRSFARDNGLGRAALINSRGTYENDHGVGNFIFRVALK